MDVLAVIERRAKRYYGTLSDMTGAVRLADSRAAEALQPETPESHFDWVITSPPYYGMRTYIPDQWLRNWFVGDPDVVDYTNRRRSRSLKPRGRRRADLRQVWRNAALSPTTPQWSSASVASRIGVLTPLISSE